MNNFSNIINIIYIYIVLNVLLGCSNPNENTVRKQFHSSDSTTIVSELDTIFSINNNQHLNLLLSPDAKNRFSIPFGVNVLDINSYNKSRTYLDSLSKSVCSKLKLKNEALYNLPIAKDIIHFDPFLGREIMCSNDISFYDMFPYGNYTHSFPQTNGLFVYYLTINAFECEFLPNKIVSYCDKSSYDKFGYLMFYDANSMNLIVIDAFHRESYGEWSKVRLFYIDESSIIHFVEYDSNEGGIEIMNKIELCPYKDSIGNVNFIKSK